MKELSIEEKARAYDNVREKIATRFGSNVAKEIFSEYEESEDERIRKELIGYFTGWSDKHLFRGFKAEQILAWLEKQGEQPRKVSIWKHWKDGIAGNGEGKLIYLVKVGNTYRLTSCLGFECDYIELSELDKLMHEKQGETFTKKDVDDAYLKGVCDTKQELEKQDEQKPAETEKGAKGNAREIPNSAWGEEDEQYLLVCKNALAKYQTTDKWDANIIFHWLENKVKSLKERVGNFDDGFKVGFSAAKYNQWKPTEFDILLLERIANDKVNPQDFRALLCGLIGQLKKLREE